jgi:hypothetical protein
LSGECLEFSDEFTLKKLLCSSAFKTLNHRFLF